MKYFYKGQPVELVPGGQFTSHWNIYYNQPTENGGSRRVIVTVTPTDLKSEEEVTSTSSSAKSTLLSLTEEAASSPQLLNVNTASFTSFVRAFPGVGRVGAKAITQTNKPTNGYKDFDELKERNSNLQINWEELKGLIEV